MGARYVTVHTPLVYCRHVCASTCLRICVKVCDSYVSNYIQRCGRTTRAAPTRTRSMASRTFERTRWATTWAAAGCRLWGRKARRRVRSARRVRAGQGSWQRQAGMHDGRVATGVLSRNSWLRCTEWSCYVQVLLSGLGFCCLERAMFCSPCRQVHAVAGSSKLHVKRLLECSACSSWPAPSFRQSHECGACGVHLTGYHLLAAACAACMVYACGVRAGTQTQTASLGSVQKRLLGCWLPLSCAECRPEP